MHLLWTIRTVAVISIGVVLLVEKRTIMGVILVLAAVF